jgi:predicted RNase H-like nuclease
MGTYVGLDWASKGWFGVVLADDGNWTTDLFPSIWSVWKEYSDADRILVDSPIGLPTDGRRACDVQAKNRLDSQQRSVFYTPTRAAVYEQNLDDAKQINEREAGFSIQNQAWSVVSRIRELDEFLDMYPGARDRVSETHPEVCFYALNGRTPVTESKQTASGLERRRDLLTEEYADARAIYEQSVSRYTEPDYAPTVSGVDDILDALAAAVTARRDADGLSRLPEHNPPADERGLPMQIVYPDDTTQTRLTSLGARH